MAIEYKVRKLIAEKLKIDIIDVEPEKRLDTLGADSLDIVELVMSIEELLEIDDIEDEDKNLKEKPWSVMTKVGEIVTFAESV